MSQPLDKILTMSNIDEITDTLSTYFKKPIVIEDDQFSLLSYSSYYIDQFDQANQETILTKRWPISILEKFMDEGIVDQLKSIPKPFRIKQLQSIGLNPRVVVSAKYKDIIYGYIWVQETNGLLTDEELTFLDEVSFHIGKLLYQENQFMLSTEEEIDHFYQKLIEQTYQSENQIKWEAANSQIMIPDSVITNVFTVDPADEIIFGELTETVQLFANALNQPTHVLINQLRIIVIIGSTSRDPEQLYKSANNLTQKVVNQFKTKKVFPGIGNAYSSILQLRKSYAEALEVINAAKFLGSPTLFTYEYRKLGIYRYLETIYRVQSETNYINEDLRILQTKDLESQTNLLETLEVLLLNNCKLKPTADQLFIHINTLKYRIKQITELTAIDLDDFHIRCQLYIDLQLMKREN